MHGAWGAKGSAMARREAASIPHGTSNVLEKGRWGKVHGAVGNPDTRIASRPRLSRVGGISRLHVGRPSAALF